mgnify:CR=1 FL=1
MSRPLRLVFAGTPHFALPALEAVLASGNELRAVYTQPDRPAGRGRQLAASPVKQRAIAAGAAAFVPPNFHDDKYRHMPDGQLYATISNGKGNMPPYAHLKDKPFDQNALPKKIAVMRQLGVPYPAMDATSIKMKALEQGAAIAEDLKKANIVVRPDSEMVAIIAYLQKLGQYDTPAVEEVLTKKSGGGVPFPLTPVNPDKARSAILRKLRAKHGGRHRRGQHHDDRRARLLPLPAARRAGL